MGQAVTPSALYTVRYIRRTQCQRSFHQIPAISALRVALSKIGIVPLPTIDHLEFLLPLLTLRERREPCKRESLRKRAITYQTALKDSEIPPSVTLSELNKLTREATRVSDFLRVFPADDSRRAIKPQ